MVFVVAFVEPRFAPSSGDDGRAAFVAGADNLEDQVSAVLVHGQMPQFVDDEEP